jgi:hypothetical protein
VECDSVVDSQDIALESVCRNSVKNKVIRGMEDSCLPATLADTTDAVFKTLAEGMVVCHRGETSARTEF